MSNARSLASFLSGTPTADFNFDSNSLVVDISENTVGIGDTTPDGKLEVRQTAAADILNLYDNTTNVLTVVDGGNVGIGDDSPDGKLEVRQSGTDDIFNLYDDTTNVLTVVDGGKVGIGTSTPDGLVDIRQSGTDDILNLYDGTNNIFTVVDGGKVGIKSATPDGMLDVRSLTSDDIFNLYDGSTNVFTVIDGGNVGIGMDTPSQQLDIGDSSSPAMRLTRTDSTIVADELLGTIEFGGDDPSAGATGARIRGYAEGAWASSDYASYLMFQTTPASSGSPAERMRITSAGNVGIGTTAPGYALDIVAATQTRGLNVNNTLASGTTFGALIQSTGTATTNIGLKAEASGATTNYAALFDGGNVGMGTTTPNYSLHVVRNANDWITQVENSATSGNMYLLRLSYSGANPDNNTSRAIELATSGGGDKFVVYSDGDVVNHDNSYGTFSDERIKTDIIDANSQWDDIKAVRVRNFKKKDDVAQYGDKAWSQIGVVAQELEKVSPKLIKHSLPNDFEMEHCGFGQNIDGEWVPKKIDGKDMMVKSVSYSVLYMKAFKALQEAMIRIETLETKVNELENA